LNILTKLLLLYRELKNFDEFLLSSFLSYPIIRSWSEYTLLQYTWLHYKI